MKLKNKMILMFISVFTLSSTAQQPPLYIADSLQKYLDNFLTHDTIPGGIVAVQHRANNWKWMGQSGLANINTMQAADASFLFRIGSVSKNFMAATILHLADRGILSLNDTIEKWLSPTLTTNIQYSNQMTIKNLLDHTSGIYSFTNDSAFLLALLTNPNASFTPDQLINIALSHPPSFTPNNNWYYNNTGYVLLTKIVESATGITYAQYATDSILIPCGMTNSYFPNSNIIAGNHMRCYADYDNDNVLEDYTDVTTTWAIGSGEIVSDLNDLLKYYNRLIDGQIITTSAYTEMRTPFYPSPTFTYGLGMFILDSTLVGHSGDYFSTTGLWYFEDLDVMVTYQFNIFHVDAYYQLLKKIHTLLSSTTASLHEKGRLSLISISPNPFSSQTVLRANILLHNATLTVYNYYGQTVKQIKNISGETITISRDNLENGLYFISLTQDNKVFSTGKLVITDR